MADRILIVDDEPAMRRSLTIMLRREEYAVFDQADGHAALDHLARDPVDLVIVDLRMDGLSGLDVLRMVKQAHPDVEVIMMTAYGTIETAVEAMRFGAFDFITKPFELEQVLLRVSERPRAAAPEEGGAPAPRGGHATRSASRPSSARATRC